MSGFWCDFFIEYIESSFIFFICTVVNMFECLVCSSVYLGDEDSPSEPDFQYIPDTPSITGQDGDPLVMSMNALREGLENGSAVAQFEVSYLRNSR
jgi:hypothetical protein